jgi:hypothetical protein
MKSRIVIYSLVILAFLLASCSAAATPAPAPEVITNPANGASAPIAPGAVGGAADSFSGAKGNAAQPPAADRLVIKNADLTIAVADPLSAMTAVMNLANTMGGFVVSSKSYKTQSKDGSSLPQATVSVRVPAAKLDDALAAIHKLVADPKTDIQSENISGQDVTADYVDLQSRLTSLQATETKLNNIMDSATKTEDVLTVFNQISSINQQIEQVKGQIKYYEDSSAMSIINVQLLALAGVNPISIGGWQPVGVVRDAFQALINVGQGLLVALIWLVIFFVPIFLVFFFPGRWIWRAYKRRQARGYAQPLTANGMMYPPPPSGPGGPPPQYPDIK